MAQIKEKKTSELMNFTKSSFFLIKKCKINYICEASMEKASFLFAEKVKTLGCKHEVWKAWEWWGFNFKFFSDKSSQTKMELWCLFPPPKGEKNVDQRIPDRLAQVDWTLNGLPYEARGIIYFLRQ